MRSRVHRNRWWLVLGAVIAGVMAASDFGTVRLLPPSFNFHSPVHSTAQTSIVLGSNTNGRYTAGKGHLSPSQNAMYQASRSYQATVYQRSLYVRMQTLGDIAGSPALRRDIARRAGISASQLAVDEALWWELLRAQQWDTGSKRSNQIVVEGDPYRITLTEDQQSPILHVTTQAPDPTAAARLAQALDSALAHFVTSNQDASHTPAADRYRVSPLTPITVQPGGKGQLINMAALVFVSVFVVWFWIVMGVSRLLDDLRTASTAAKVRESQDRFIGRKRSLGSSRRSRRVIHGPRTTGL